MVASPTNNPKYPDGGCGPHPFTTGESDRFQKECALHDDCYKSKRLPKWLCDKNFFDRMKVKDWLYDMPPQKRWLYGGLVGIFGWACYYL